MSTVKQFQSVEPEHKEIVGRLDNEIDPNEIHPKRVLTHPIIGRIHNESSSGQSHRKALAHPIIGRINNELHPTPPLWRGPAKHKVGRIFNEWVGRRSAK